MSRKIFVLCCLLIISTYGLQAKNKNYNEPYQSTVQVKILAGVNLPVTNLLKGLETDYLLQYDDRSFYWQAASTTLFFHRHWGVEFNYQASLSNYIDQRESRFKDWAYQQYNDNYYVQASTSALSKGDMNYSDRYFLGDIHRGYLGMVYRFESGKFYVYPKLGIGIMSFKIEYGSIHLKEKKSNNEFEIYYSGPTGGNNMFTLAASTSFGYKLFNRMYINADIMFSYFRTDFTIKKTFSDLNTKEELTEYINYTQNNYPLSLGVGLIFVFY